MSDETLTHVVNCGAEGEKIENIEETLMMCNDKWKLAQIANRIEDFLSRVET